MANHALPTLTSTYTAVLTQLDDRFDDQAKMFDPATVTTTVSGVPTNTIRWNSATNNWTKFNGSTWVALSSTYAINISGTAASVSGTVAVANGGTGGTTAAAARTNLGLVIGTDVPSPIGTGASGSWGISVTGNAATVTNGVYTTGNQTIAGEKTFSSNFYLSGSRFFQNNSSIGFEMGPGVGTGDTTKQGMIVPAGKSILLFANGGATKLALEPAGAAFNGYPMYVCRAWVNFNGTGTVAIRASGNVSSITDNGIGSYTLNFTTALPDVNYAVMATSSTSSAPRAAGSATANQLTSSCLIRTVSFDGSFYDPQDVHVAIFR